MQERYISSGSSRLHIAVWEPSGERKAIMQISHGMIEYIKRYSHFANYLNQAGILVIGNDHKGHGLTAEKDEDLGYFGEEKSAAVIEDLHEVTVWSGCAVFSVWAQHGIVYGETLSDDLWRGTDRGNYLRDRLHAGGSFDGRKTLCGCDQ